MAKGQGREETKADTISITLPLYEQLIYALTILMTIDIFSHLRCRSYCRSDRHRGIQILVFIRLGCGCGCDCGCGERVVDSEQSDNQAENNHIIIIIIKRIEMSAN